MENNMITRIKGNKGLGIETITFEYPDNNKEEVRVNVILTDVPEDTYYTLSPDDIAYTICRDKIAKKKYVFIFGSEPFDQMDALTRLCKILKNNGFKIIMYSNKSIQKYVNTWEQIRIMDDSQLDDTDIYKAMTLIENVDIIIEEDDTSLQINEIKEHDIFLDGKKLPRKVDPSKLIWNCTEYPQLKFILIHKFESIVFVDGKIKFNKL